MMLAGVPVSDTAPRRLRAGSGAAGADELADRWKHGLADVSLLALTIAGGRRSWTVLEDGPDELAELRAVLCKEHEWRVGEGLDP